MAGNAFITILLATTLQYLWGMVNALQIMVMTVFFYSLIPPNASVIMVEILKACNFELFDSEPYFEYFDFGDSESYTVIFEESGFSGSIFMPGLGCVFLFVALFPIYVVVHSLMRYMFKDEQKIKCIKNFIQPKNFGVIVVVFMLEGCVELGLGASVSLLMLDSDRVSSFWECFSTGLAIFFCIILSIVPFYTMIAGYRLYKAKKKRDRKTVRKLRPIFNGKRLKNAIAIQHATFFFVRRYMMMFLLVFFPTMVQT